MNPKLHERHAEDFADRDAVQRLQRDKLARLGARLAQSPAWVEHFAQAGLRPTDLGQPGALTRLPMLEKADLHRQYPFPFLTVPTEQVARFCSTSGTTGNPVLFGYTGHDWNVTLVRQMARIYRTVGIRPGDRVYQGYGYGMWIGGPAQDGTLAPYGATTVPVGPGRGELVVQWLRDHAYTVATMSPLWLMTLITLARQRGIEPRHDWRLRLGLFGGQSVSRQFRDELEAQMPAGFKAHNIYGTTEAGGPVLGISCDHSHDADEMHLINDDSVLTELLDPVSLEPVAPGEIGEIVITTLDKQASPVVRWRTRDLARLSRDPGGCACGRHGFPLIGRIVGRSDDMLKVRGVQFFPSQVEDVVTAIDGTVREAWQIYIDPRDDLLEELTVEIERQAQAACAAADLARTVAERLRARLGLTITVRCHEEGTLPRYEAKATRVIRRPARPAA
ncbi:MAG TPA: AMP-binding protein [Burkholderiaceae bacterium]|nr:AMP-binding protein [Burkholderiaceae bacterium]